MPILTSRITELPTFDKSSNFSNAYRIFLNTDESGWIVVTSPDIPSLITQGKTEDEAIKNAMDVVKLLKEEKYIEEDINLLIISNI